MYAVDPMFLDVMECNTLPGDYLCVQSGYNRPFTTFLYPCLSVVIFSLLHAGIMNGANAVRIKMIWLLVGCESLLLLALMVAMLARDGFVLSQDIGSVLTGTVFASLPLLGMALAQTFAVAIVSLQINRKTADFILKTGCPCFRRPFIDETSTKLKKKKTL